MNERVSEIASNVAKWATEALVEWGTSIKDSPEAHVYTLLLGAATATVMRWII